MLSRNNKSTEITPTNLYTALSQGNKLIDKESDTYGLVSDLFREKREKRVKDVIQLDKLLQINIEKNRSLISEMGLFAAVLGNIESYHDIALLSVILRNGFRGSLGSLPTVEAIFDEKAKNYKHPIVYMLTCLIRDNPKGKLELGRVASLLISSYENFSLDNLAFPSEESRIESVEKGITFEEFVDVDYFGIAPEVKRINLLTCRTWISQTEFCGIIKFDDVYDVARNFFIRDEPEKAIKVMKDELPEKVPRSFDFKLIVDFNLENTAKKNATLTDTWLAKTGGIYKALEYSILQGSIPGITASLSAGLFPNYFDVNLVIVQYKSQETFYPVIKNNLLEILKRFIEIGVQIDNYQKLGLSKDGKLIDNKDYEKTLYEKYYVNGARIIPKDPADIPYKIKLAQFGLSFTDCLSKDVIAMKIREYRSLGGIEEFIKATKNYNVGIVTSKFGLEKYIDIGEVNKDLFANKDITEADFLLYPQVFFVIYRDCYEKVYLFKSEYYESLITERINPYDHRDLPEYILKEIEFKLGEIKAIGVSPITRISYRKAFDTLNEIDKITDDFSLSVKNNIINLFSVFSIDFREAVLLNFDILNRILDGLGMRQDYLCKLERPHQLITFCRSIHYIYKEDKFRGGIIIRNFLVKLRENMKMYISMNAQLPLFVLKQDEINEDDFKKLILDTSEKIFKIDRDKLLIPSRKVLTKERTAEPGKIKIRVPGEVEPRPAERETEETQEEVVVPQTIQTQQVPPLPKQTSPKKQTQVPPKPTQTSPKKQTQQAPPKPTQTSPKKQTQVPPPKQEQTSPKKQERTPSGRSPALSGIPISKEKQKTMQPLAPRGLPEEKLKKEPPKATDISEPILKEKKEYSYGYFEHGTKTYRFDEQYNLTVDEPGKERRTINFDDRDAEKFFTNQITDLRKSISKEMDQNRRKAERGEPITDKDFINIDKDVAKLVKVYRLFVKMHPTRSNLEQFLDIPQARSEFMLKQYDNMLEAEKRIKEIKKEEIEFFIDANKSS